MAESKRRYVRPNLGGSLRAQAETPRRQFLSTDVTVAEYAKIRQYCRARQISLSQFLADLVLKDADKPKAQRKNKVTLKLEIELTPQEHDKLEVLARLYQKESVSEFVRGILEPNLKVQRVHAPQETRLLRCYLSEEEHEKVTARIASTGMSTRNYAAMLALREIRKVAGRRNK